jgi:membrane protein
VRLPGRDIPWKTFFIALKDEVKKDNLSDGAGALTFFGVLALFPFLLFLVSLAGLIIEPAQARALLDELSQVMPKEASSIIGDRLTSLTQDRNVGLLSLGALGAIWAASNGVMAVIRALNLTYGVRDSRPFWKVRGIALLFTLGGGALGLLATLATVATPPLAAAIGGPIGTAILLLRIPLAALLLLFVWALAYYVLPDVEQDFKFITPGSVVGVTVWIIASLGFSVYVSNFGKYDATYGSLGGVIVLLLWMWISAQVLLLGAEINAIIEHWSPEGKAPGEKTLDGSVYEPAEGRGSPPVRVERGRDVPRQPRRALRDVGMAAWGALVAAALLQLRRRAVD